MIALKRIRSESFPMFMKTLDWKKMILYMSPYTMNTKVHEKKLNYPVNRFLRFLDFFITSNK